MRRTKIVCTLGPASSSEEMIENMLRAGMNVARLNFSHSTHENHKKMIEMFRSVRDRLDMSAAVMLDTRGPEIRIRTFDGDGVTLEEGGEFTLTTRDVPGSPEIVSITYKELPSQLVRGNRILVDDGKICLEVKKTTDTDIICKVIEGGILKNKKSINIPNIKLNMTYLSEQDKQDLLFGIENDVDFVSASFVRTKDDAIALRKFLDYNGGHDIRIISKIENMQGVENFDEILENSDGIMVARGDMGVEVAFEKIPGLQKVFIKKCYQSGKIVITATQMLESMITKLLPTRAEITDVANAVFDGTSAVMLSGETAMGDHPDRVVTVMSKIVEQAEADAFAMNSYRGIRYDNDVADMTNAICDAACTTARDINAMAIIAVTKSGLTARRVSKFRPFEPIISSTPVRKTFHQLSMSWGVVPVFARSQDDLDSLFLHAIDCAKQIDLVAAGDKVVIIAGSPVNIQGTTNILKVQTVEKNV